MNVTKVCKSHGSTINSREVATMVDMRHDHLLDKIAKIISDLGGPNSRVSSFFIETTYLTEQNKRMKCYELTRKGKFPCQIFS